MSQHRAPENSRRGPIVALTITAVAVGVLAVAAVKDQPTSVAAAIPSASAPPTPEPVEPVEPVELAVTVLAAQTCGRINDDPTSGGVWRAVAALERGALALTTDQSWAAVDLFVRLDCEQHIALVTDTIGSIQ